MKNFAPLHIESGYTFLNSGLTIEKIKYAMQKNDYFGAGISDINVLFGFPSFSKMMMEINKPYILGMSLKIDEDYFSLFVKDEIGYQNIVFITNLIQKQEISLNDLKEHFKNLICVLHTDEGYFKNTFPFIDKQDTKFNKYLNNYATAFEDNFYLGLNITSKEDFLYANKIREFVKTYPYTLLAFPKIRYLKKDDAIVLKIVNAIKNEEKIKEKKEIGQEYFMDESSYCKIYTKEEMKASIDIINKSNFEFVQKRGELLKFSDSDSFFDLKTITFNKLKELNIDDDAHINRLNHELEIINSMGYCDYFLLVSDYVNYAKNNNILVGPGRGSAAGSLVSYLLNITEVDPLEYDLLFERFLNPDRKTMPDIDVDFEDIKRDEVINYLINKYGQNKVSSIITFQTIQAKQALRDIGRIYDYPERHISLLSKRLTNKNYDFANSYRHLEEFKKIVDSDKYFLEIVSLARKIEGLPRQHGIHPAGIVLNNTNLTDNLPVIFDFDENLISQYEAPELEEQGYLKMDILALRNLTIISYCVDLINYNHQDSNILKNAIPYKEKEIFDLIQSAKTMGIFQIESYGMQRAIKILKPSCFEDVVALIALFRPGPMDSIKDYALRKQNRISYQINNPKIKKILESTFGILLYQEQISQLAIVMAGLSPSQADTFRRAVSKKDESKMDSLKDQFINGSINNGFSKKESEDMFNDIKKFANYGFNKSHAVVYAILACRMAYLKSHYPLEFYATILQTSSSSNDTKFNEYISEIKQRGLKIFPPNINTSQQIFKVCDNGLLFPLTCIKNINSLIAQNIINERNKCIFNNFFDFVLRMYPYNITENQIINLINAGALDCFSTSRSSLLNSTKKAMQFAQMNFNENGQISLDINLPHPNLSDGEDNPLEKLDNEYESLGIMLSDNPLNFKKDTLIAKNVVSILEAEYNENVTIAGIIKNVKINRTKKGDSMAYIKIYDQTSEVEVTIFPRVFVNKISIIEKNNIVIIKGRFENEEKSSFIAENIELMEN